MVCTVFSLIHQNSPSHVAWTAYVHAMQRCINELHLDLFLHSRLFFLTLNIIIIVCVCVSLQVVSSYVMSFVRTWR